MILYDLKNMRDDRDFMPFFQRQKEEIVFNKEKDKASTESYLSINTR